MRPSIPARIRWPAKSLRGTAGREVRAKKLTRFLAPRLGAGATFRVVFQLRDIEGFSTEETAEALELSVPAVKWRLLRARLKLRQKLNRYFRRGENA